MGSEGTISPEGPRQREGLKYAEQEERCPPPPTHTQSLHQEGSPKAPKQVSQSATEPKDAGGCDPGSKEDLSILSHRHYEGLPGSEASG